MRRIVEVPVDGRSYSIHIGTGLLQDTSLWQSLIGNAQAFVISDDQVAGHWLPAVQQMLSAVDYEHYIMPAGDQHKSLDQFSRIMDRMMASKRRRNGIVIALGGGVVGDLAGFVAATYQRGCAIIQVPTTLLAMVDSSVGGKTAINHPAGKNMIGAFHHPRAVIADLQTLTTLPSREFAAGMAEVIKYAVIKDREFLPWLEQHCEALVKRHPAALIDAIARSCENKASIVSRDPTEQGERALLNLGHTFGHAIETELGYGTWLHGEAVATGVILACKLAERLGRLADDALRRRLQSLFTAFDLPVALPSDIDLLRLIEHMKLDKKNQRDEIRFVLPNANGESDIVDGVPVAAVLDALQQRD